MEERYDIDPGRPLIDAAAGRLKTGFVYMAAMAEDSPFGKAGRPGCVLNLCRVYRRGVG